jgi:hypothetical protein
VVRARADVGLTTAREEVSGWGPIVPTTTAANSRADVSVSRGAYKVHCKWGPTGGP